MYFLLAHKFISLKRFCAILTHNVEIINYEEWIKNPINLNEQVEAVCIAIRDILLSQIIQHKRRSIIHNIIKRGAEPDDVDRKIMEAIFYEW